MRQLASMGRHDVDVAGHPRRLAIRVHRLSAEEDGVVSARQERQDLAEHIGKRNVFVSRELREGQW
jgi:hypothetical protein